MHEIDAPGATPTDWPAPDAMNKFAATETPPEERHHALTALITAKVLPKAADDPRVMRGRQHWHELAVNGSEPAHRLLAVAESIRLGQVVRRWSDAIANDLAPVFTNELPPMQLLADADDRLNLARACAQANASWLPGYLATAVAWEETGEKPRAECLAALLARVPTLKDAVQWLADAFEALRPTTESPGDTIARRLTRTLSALRAALVESELDAGNELGKTLYRLVAGPLAQCGRPQEDKVQIELSREALLTVHDVVRTRLSMVTDPDVYSVVEYCKRMCGGSGWPKELNMPLERLIKNVTEALLLLGRQHQCDQRLLSQLHVLTSYPERARAIARDLSSRHPELHEDVRHWLEKGRLRVNKPASAAAVETVVSRADESVGLALQVARELQDMGEALREPLKSSLEIYEPGLVSPALSLVKQAQRLASEIEQVAGLRGLGLHGVPGQEIEMSPKYFTPVGAEPRLRMTVRQPAVVRLRPDGSLGDVITKGLVE